MTIRLFDENSHLREFDATVCSCEPGKGGTYFITLDRTAFFPEAGGQPADTGTLGPVHVTDVHERGGEIIHTVDAPLTVGTTVHGALDWEPRLRRMQNHTGEHIVSGLIHRDYGFANVGFHIGSRDVTLDFDGVLERDALRRIEYLANVAVAENVTVTAEYPAPEKLATLEYRSKLDLTENVRIVTITGYDCCACCAPHVKRTGEIGMIKLLDYIHYKGGIRIHMQCGLDALDDFNEKYDNVAQIAASLSVKQADAAAAVARLSDAMTAQKQTIAELKRELVRAKLALIPSSDAGLLLFEPTLDMDGLRALAEGASKRRGGICAVFAGRDAAGYQYAAASQSQDMRAFARNLNIALSGRGGGSTAIIQGSVSAGADAIRTFFQALGAELS